MESLKKEILVCCASTAELLSGGFDYKETCYQNLLIHELSTMGWICHKEVNIGYRVKGITLSYGRIDIVAIKDKNVFVLELKAVPNISKIALYRSQVKRYQRHYHEECTGCLIIFNDTCDFHAEFI